MLNANSPTAVHRSSYLPDVKDKRLAEEEVLEPEAGGHPAVVEEVAVAAVVFQRHLLGWFLAQRVFNRLPRLVLGVLGVDEAGIVSEIRKTD